MIKKVLLNNAATYKNEVLEPNKINYLYGSNGSGKTTISRLIKNASKFQGSEVLWDNEELETIVYNKDFIDENFANSESIKGIFTLGKDTKDAKEAIEVFKSKIDAIKKNIDGYSKVFNKTQEEISSLNENFQEKCWNEKKKYEVPYKEAFSGYIGKKEMFKKKCIEEYSMGEVAIDLDALSNEYNTIFRQNIKTYNSIQEINILEIQEKNSSDILKMIITGKNTVEIAGLISKLQNSDWVREGIKYLSKSDGKCPFCQQVHRDLLQEEIENYFDETYEINCNKLKEFQNQYDEYFKGKITELKNIVDSPNEILDFSKLSKIIVDIENLYSQNMGLIDDKIERPSIQIELKSMEDLFLQVIKIIKEYNKIIEENNNLIKHISTKKAELKTKVWKFIVNNLKSDIEEYEKQYKSLQKRKNGIMQAIDKGQKEIRGYEKSIKEKEYQITSVVPTVNEINNILLSFGFIGFKLDEGKEKGEYKIIRNDGTDVNETLSEGEYRFITFLYFYQLIKGSNESSGLTKDKIVFIDDPISSLDSNVLFIVSNLVKNIIKDCIDNSDGIKQVFVSTHNLYFYKEIIFKGNGKSRANEETYWIIRKKDEASSINKYEGNPVQTTYELLWRELDNPSRCSKANIFNTLRRILEYYFNILGGLNYEKCINEFEGEEKLLCKSLISFINDGSHFISDDLILCIEDDDIERYLKVFKMIFVKMGHESHYNMMMKIV